MRDHAHAATPPDPTTDTTTATLTRDPRGAIPIQLVPVPFAVFRSSLLNLCCHMPDHPAQTKFNLLLPGWQQRHLKEKVPDPLPLHAPE